MLGVEGSPTLARAAREADPPTEVIVADAAALPLPDAHADLALASISLLNVDDLPGAVREVTRVLAPGGRFCVTTVHPFRSWQTAGGSYFAETRFTEARERDGARMAFHDTHRPLGDLFAALEAAGLVVEAVREPVPDDAHLAAHPDAARARERPLFLHVRALKPG